ncbi:MAG: ABC transporter [Rhodospirillales bacterium]|nr:ABC transporter [Rhodospirillales bacterium]|tara:strand:- start:1574 stop:2341 length:768 start_codon:yes stop_codon:yes gene_type:complete
MNLRDTKKFMKKIAIDIKSLTKNFGCKIAVNKISFKVNAGSITGLLGGNGAGKTTTIAMILGLLLPTSGKIRVLGEDIITSRYKVLSRINFSSPYVELPKRLTVQQNLRIFAGLYGMGNSKEDIENLAESFALNDFLDLPTGQLSSGQRSRVSLAKALINSPSLLLLDEPTASLDPETASWIRSYLEEYASKTGATILLASHNMDEVSRLCSDVIIMRNGNVVDQGAPKALIKKYERNTLEDVFLQIARAEFNKL